MLWAWIPALFSSTLSAGPDSDLTSQSIWLAVYFCSFFFFFFPELGTEPRALRFLGKRSTTELNPQPLQCIFKVAVFLFIPS
ncbi:rCG52991, isoform CRA_d [Rattus norvegicus]|uniref:RCG52991, isoform CRA_d n=1 Tax=Rattus norvegicus TaxID=10116 RepID=A6IRR9_RAT|nr:rCG52991, isoform CRA_d [Rattus norvegicus]